MEIINIILTILSIASIPSTVTVIMFNRIMKRFDKEKEARDEFILMTTGLSEAAIDLSEVTAISYINDRRNGELTESLCKAKKVKDEYTKFVTKYCVSKIQ